ncbi:hypothetical protein [Micromonospora sp. NBC_00421]|uniref:hypothetical protein n=1 Tax=Micromonospora sp. NBC_00421 TaxID=2975976 RepID=UPI002E1BCF7C
MIIDPLLLRLYAGDASAGIGQLAMLGASVGYYSPLAAEVVVGDQRRRAAKLSPAAQDAQRPNTEKVSLAEGPVSRSASESLSERRHRGVHANLSTAGGPSHRGDTSDDRVMADSYVAGTDLDQRHRGQLQPELAGTCKFTTGPALGDGTTASRRILVAAKMACATP